MNCYLFTLHMERLFATEGIKDFYGEKELISRAAVGKRAPLNSLPLTPEHIKARSTGLGVDIPGHRHRGCDTLLAVNTLGQLEAGKKSTENASKCLAETQVRSHC